MDDDDEDERRRRVEQLASHKPYNMKSLGRLVDSNRLTGVARPEPVGPASSEPPSSGPPSSGPSSARSAPTRPGLPRRNQNTPTEPDPELETAEEELGGFSDVVDESPDTDERVDPIDAQDEDPTGDDDALDGEDPASAAVFVDDDDPEFENLDTPLVEDEPSPPESDGVDRSGMGGAVTRTGLARRLESSAPLARQMLEDEIAPGGRISDPEDVSGIVLDLAKDIPASVAVSVVRMDEEAEIVGDTVDPSIDPSLFSTVFSSAIEAVRPAAELLENGPLGVIQDVVIEGEHMDLILRPLGDRYYLMVLENRHDPNANLGLARLRMASIAPAMSALLAQQDGEV